MLWEHEAAGSNPVAPTNSLASKLLKESHSVLLKLGSLIFFTVSLGFPAFVQDDRTQIMGWVTLVFGWGALMTGIFGWLANLIVIVAWILALMKKHHAAFVVSAIAFVVGLSSLILLTRMIPEININTYNWVAVKENRVVSMGLGFYLWLLSLLCFCLGCYAANLPAGAVRRPVPSAPPPRVD